MKKKAIISVLSRQKGKIDDVIEVVTPGDFYKKEDCYYAVYKETEISGMEGTTTTLKIRPEKLSLIRMGTTSAKMEFEGKKKNITLYNTPYGVLELEIDTKNIKVNVDQDGGEILINYNMSLAGEKPQNNSLEIQIKTK